MYIAPIYLYCFLTVILPVALYFIKYKYIWLSLALAVIVDTSVYWREFGYYEARPLMIILTVVQLLVIAIIIYILKLVFPK